MTAQDYLPNEGRKWRNEVTDTTRYRNYKGSGPGVGTTRVVDPGGLYEEFHTDVTRISRVIANQWPGVMDSDAIEQELWVDILSSPQAAEDLRKAKKAIKKDFNPVHALLSKKATIICIKERESYEYFTAQWCYSSEEVKAMAPEILTKPGAVTEEVIDFMDALQLLIERQPRYADAFLERYADGDLPKASSKKATTSRAVKQMTLYMNRTRKRNEADAVGPTVDKYKQTQAHLYEGFEDAEEEMMFS